MNNEDFQKVVQRRIDMITKVLAAKADEYARGDRLSNFKQAASLMNKRPIEAAAGMMVKHVVAFYNFVNDWGDRHQVQHYERWDEKITDIINYLILSDALIIEFDKENDRATVIDEAK